MVTVVVAVVVVVVVVLKVLLVVVVLEVFVRVVLEVLVVLEVFVMVCVNAEVAVVLAAVRSQSSLQHRARVMFGHGLDTCRKERSPEQSKYSCRPPSTDGQRYSPSR